MTKEELSEILDDLYSLAKEAKDAGEIPVSCCLVLKDGRRFYERNRVEERKNNLAHAEFLALEKAREETGLLYFKGSHLIVTLEPCLFCMGAIVKRGVSQVSYVLEDEKLGSLSHYHAFVDDRLDVLPLFDPRFKPLMDEFFQTLREK